MALSVRAMEAPAERSHPRIAILLGTHQGERYLADQLKSIALQTWTNWEVWASDDHSTDATWEILSAYRAEWGDERLRLYRGPTRGFCTNFLTLACKPAITAELFSFCDQDDIWDEDKLERAVRWHLTIPEGVPALYCGRTRLIDRDGRYTGQSPLFRRPAGFRNALVQSIAGGNTMVINQAARALLVEAGSDVGVLTHDWWSYLAVCGCGGNVFYDPIPSLGYRQHTANLVGSNLGIAVRARRTAHVIEGRWRAGIDRNVEALGRLSHRLTEENLAILAEFAQARKRGLAGRIAGLRRSGVYCLTVLGSISLAAAAVLNKL